MTTHYVKIVIDPNGDNYTVPRSELMRTVISRKLNNPSTFEFSIWNPNGSKNSTYEMDDEVIIYVDRTDPPSPTSALVKGRIEEIEIQRDRYGKNIMTCRGEDYLSILASRFAKGGPQGTNKAGQILINLIEKFASEFGTTNIDKDGGIKIVDYTVGTQKTFLSILRELAQMPQGTTFDFYIDGNNDIHFFERNAIDSGITVDSSNIRKLSSRRSVKDKKTLIVLRGAQAPEEEGSNSQLTVSDYVSLSDYHYADDFFAEHENVMQIKLYVQKVGTPGADLTGRIVVAKYDAPGGIPYEFTPVAESDVPTTPGWITIPIYMSSKIGTRYFIKLDKIGSDSSNTYRWYGDIPAVIDRENLARRSSTALKWESFDADLSMRIYYGRPVDIEVDKGESPKREIYKDLHKPVPEDIAVGIANNYLNNYYQTQWMANIEIDAPSSDLNPGELITLNETGSGLASKKYRMESINWEFGPLGIAETVTISLSSVLPYESLDEVISRMIEDKVGMGGGSLEEGEPEIAEPAKIGYATVNRSLVGYVPGG